MGIYIALKYLVLYLLLIRSWNPAESFASDDTLAQSIPSVASSDYTIIDSRNQPAPNLKYNVQTIEESKETLPPYGKASHRKVKTLSITDTDSEAEVPRQKPKQLKQTPSEYKLHYRKPISPTKSEIKPIDLDISNRFTTHKIFYNLDEQTNTHTFTPKDNYVINKVIKRDVVLWESKNHNYGYEVFVKYKNGQPVCRVNFHDYSKYFEEKTKTKTPKKPPESLSSGISVSSDETDVQHRNYLLTLDINNKTSNRFITYHRDVITGTETFTAKESFQFGLILKGFKVLWQSSHGEYPCVAVIEREWDGKRKLHVYYSHLQKLGEEPEFVLYPQPYTEKFPQSEDSEYVGQWVESKPVTLQDILNEVQKSAVNLVEPKFEYKSPKSDLPESTDFITIDLQDKYTKHYIPKEKELLEGRDFININIQSTTHKPSKAEYEVTKEEEQVKYIDSVEINLATKEVELKSKEKKHSIEVTDSRSKTHRPLETDDEERIIISDSKTESAFKREEIDDLDIIDSKSVDGEDQQSEYLQSQTKRYEDLDTEFTDDECDHLTIPLRPTIKTQVQPSTEVRKPDIIKTRQIPRAQVISTTPPFSTYEQRAGSLRGYRQPVTTVPVHPSESISRRLFSPSHQVFIPKEEYRYPSVDMSLTTPPMHHATPVDTTPKYHHVVPTASPEYDDSELFVRDSQTSKYLSQQAEEMEGDSTNLLDKKKPLLIEDSRQTPKDAHDYDFFDPNFSSTYSNEPHSAPSVVLEIDDDIFSYMYILTAVKRTGGESDEVIYSSDNLFSGIDLSSPTITKSDLKDPNAPSSEVPKGTPKRIFIKLHPGKSAMQDPYRTHPGYMETYDGTLSSQQSSITIELDDKVFSYSFDSDGRVIPESSTVSTKSDYKEHYEDQQTTYIDPTTGQLYTTVTQPVTYSGTDDDLLSTTYTPTYTYHPTTGQIYTTVTQPVTYTGTDDDLLSTTYTPTYTYHPTAAPVAAQNIYQPTPHIVYQQPVTYTGTDDIFSTTYSPTYTYHPTAAPVAAQNIYQPTPHIVYQQPVTYTGTDDDIFSTTYSPTISGTQTSMPYKLSTPTTTDSDISKQDQTSSTSESKSSKKIFIKKQPDSSSKTTVDDDDIFSDNLTQSLSHAHQYSNANDIFDAYYAVTSSPTSKYTNQTEDATDQKKGTNYQDINFKYNPLSSTPYNVTSGSDNYSTFSSQYSITPPPPPSQGAPKIPLSPLNITGKINESEPISQVIHQQPTTHIVYQQPVTYTGTDDDIFSTTYSPISSSRPSSVTINLDDDVFDSGFQVVGSNISNRQNQQTLQPKFSIPTSHSQTPIVITPQTTVTQPAGTSIPLGQQTPGVIAAPQIITPTQPVGSTISTVPGQPAPQVTPVVTGAAPQVVTVTPQPTQPVAVAPAAVTVPITPVVPGASGQVAVTPQPAGVAGSQTVTIQPQISTQVGTTVPPLNTNQQLSSQTVAAVHPGHSSTHRTMSTQPKAITPQSTTVTQPAGTSIPLGQQTPGVIAAPQQAASVVIPQPAGTVPQGTPVVTGAAPQVVAITPQPTQPVAVAPAPVTVPPQPVGMPAASTAPQTSPPKKPELQIFTLNNDGNTTENDTTKYNIQVSGGSKPTKTYELNTDVKCVKVIFKGNEWNYDSSKFDGKYPQKIIHNTNNNTVSIDMGDNKKVNLSSAS